MNTTTKTQGETPIKIDSNKKYVLTSESVTEGHPDKIADQISDAILDEVLKQDANGRVACETLISKGLVVVSGEITTTAQISVDEIVRNTITNIGYDRAKYGFDGHNCGIISAINQQSPDIAMGVDTGGAGDQGLMFGYASNETPELMPLTIALSHRLARRLATVRRNNTIDYLRPDGKVQVTVQYQGNTPVAIDTIVVSSQHADHIHLDELRKDITKHVINPIMPDNLDTSNITLHINPTGRFVIGGPSSDCGLTGRKIIVDTYGGIGRHGGGAFSGKDPSKVDRSAAYMARYLAKNIVASGAANIAEVQIAYAIGVAEPVSLNINLLGTGEVDEEKLSQFILKNVDLTPNGIINKLNLKRGIYLPTAAYGHFGREEFSWEATDLAKKITEQL